MSRSPSRAGSIYRLAGRLLAELAIVFLGVYGAFWVENYRDRVDQENRVEQAAEAIRRDLRDYIGVTHQFIAAIERGLADWEAARAGGETPPPYYFRIQGSEVPSLAVWDAVIELDIAELLDAGLLFELAFFYSELAGSGPRYRRYMEFTEREILPLLHEDVRSFYQGDPTRLKPMFRAHMDRLRELRDMMAILNEWADCLLVRLETPTAGGASCRP